MRQGAGLVHFSVNHKDGSQNLPLQQSSGFRTSGMVFTDFKSIAQVQEAYGVAYTEASFCEAKDLMVPDSFRQELEFNRQYIDVFTSEASRCEAVIYPVLREVYKSLADRASLWSHRNLTYDAQLSGIPDYLVATRSPLGKTVLGQPIVLIVEAKQNNFVEGWGQCLAELIAAQRLGSPEQVYGVVTDGEFWQFGQLQGSTFTKDTLRLTLSDLDRLFQTLGFLIDRGLPPHP